MFESGLISVIIPVFNVRPYLTEALKSVIRQTYSHLEIIVIDDGSTDGSGDICDEFAKRDDRIKVVHRENRGLSNARNTGLDMMSGEAVAFLDSDDSYHPDFIKVMAEEMDRANADIAVCRYIMRDENASLRHIRKELVYPKGKAGMYRRIEALQALASGNINVNVWNKLYRSRLWKNTRFSDGHNYEDMDIMFRIFDICSSVSVLDQPLYYHLRRPGSITQSLTETNLGDSIRARRHFEEFVAANTPAVFSYEQLRRNRQRTLSWMMVNYVRYSGEKGEVSKSALDRFRTQIIEADRELGIGSMDLSRKAAHLMMLKCPDLLKISYSAYRAVRILIRETTGK